MLEIKYFQRLEKCRLKSVSKVENVDNFWDFGNETNYDTNHKKPYMEIKA